MKITRGTAIIIGASSGIGEALARELYQRGWRLGLLARRVDKLQTLAAELGAERIQVGYLDVADGDAVARLHAMVEQLDEVDLVIISAGCGYLNPARRRSRPGNGCGQRHRFHGLGARGLSSFSQTRPWTPGGHYFGRGPARKLRSFRICSIEGVPINVPRWLA